jgi:hypothetical protein
MDTRKEELLKLHKDLVEGRFTPWLNKEQQEGSLTCFMINLQG